MEKIEDTWPSLVTNPIHHVYHTNSSNIANISDEQAVTLHIDIELYSGISVLSLPVHCITYISTLCFCVPVFSFRELRLSILRSLLSSIVSFFFFSLLFLPTWPLFAFLPFLFSCLPSCLCFLPFFLTFLLLNLLLHLGRSCSSPVYKPHKPR